MVTLNKTLAKDRKKIAFSAKSRQLLLGALLPVSLLFLWEWAGRSGYLNPLLLPAPSAIWNEFIFLLQQQHLLGHLQVSVIRALAGLAIGGSLGLVLGLIIGFSYKSQRAFDPTIQMIRMLPHLAIAPLFILWFGFGETSKLLLIAKGAFFPLYINTFLGIRSADSKLFEVARVLQFNKMQLVLKLIIPSALPHILLGLRLSVGVSWLGLVVAEMMGSTEGIGFLINDARSMSIITTVFVGIIIFALLGKLSDFLVLTVEKKLLNWQSTFEGGK
ncbi:sulfonate transport system permease protein [Solibacillus kalamii]|uniref:ABC transporter permease n=1 Tax=Solibacillus kalamii TaxID=1748298 RepID=A0ABX3ZGF9_9BACL|nr:ABC transporter permease [Solibacillus kalamii]MBM7665750.1 sulfonate transport system permease protein [Solibacillus kalamii]OUZ38802.1 ABC transporter permease [Solibacillus kalamii]